ncbi:hypothetical protein F5141DRAFT_1213785 [Pisolithus sp. B1]|nr:hypothetical protein F5141DRAFT_1213785 [Pisolithus sp. B1]
MHLCLLVDEILRLIFRCIKDRKTLCALARTCRAFSEPAADLIWETLSDMQLILRNISCERILCEGRHPRLTQSQSLRLSDDDWGIFRRISSHVRRLDFYAFSVDNDVHPWLSFLTSPPNPSFLFPNLHSLSFEAPPLNYSRANNSEDIHAAFPTIARLFCLLLGPRLCTLRLNVPGAFYTYFDLSFIPMLSLNIRVLSIVDPKSEWGGGGYSVPDEAIYPFSRVVSNLEVFRSDVISWDLLTSLAHAKALRRLWIYLPRWLGPRTERPSGTIFPQLRTLDIRANSLASCAGFFRWTPLTNVTEITIYCSSSGADDDDVLQAVVDMSSLISPQCMGLESIFSLFRNRFSYGGIPSTGPRPMLEPFQTCHRLRVIALETLCHLTLADSDLEDLVKAWPLLEAFHLIQRGLEHPLIRLTLRGITSLLYHCPKLTHFTLMFDATRVPEDIARLSLGTLSAVRYMGVDRSSVSPSTDVPAYFSTIMPHLEIVTVHDRHHYWSEWNWVCSQHQHRPLARKNSSPDELFYLLAATANTEFRGRDWV